MKLQARVLALPEIAEIVAFESAKLESTIADATTRMMASWNAKWRSEALEFYLPLGWSFAIRDEQEVLQGYFLAQPLLFFRGHTQNLWVEHLAYSTMHVRDELMDLAVRWGRDKHLQRVLFADWAEDQTTPAHLAIQRIENNIAEVRTTKS